MSGASFTVSLIDKVTGPSKQIANSVGNVQQSFGKLRDESGRYIANQKLMVDGNFKASGAFEALGGEAKALKGPMRAVAAAAVAAAAAVVGLTVAGAAFAIEQSEIKAKTLAVLSALTGSTAAGAATLSMLDGLRGKLGETRAELVPQAQQLLANGVAAKDLATQLTALASVKAIGTPAGEEEYTKILKKMSAQVKISNKDLVGLGATGVGVSELAKQMGLSVKQLQAGLKAGTVSSAAFSAALTKAVTAKGAGALAQQANSLTAQWSLFKESIGQLFEGVDAGPFLAALKSLLSIFGQGTASGKTMKVAITGAFNGILNAAAKVLPYIKNGLEVMIIWGLKAYIAIKQFFSGAQGGDKLKAVLVTVGIALVALLSPVLIVVAAVVLMGVALAAVVALFVAIVAGISKAYAAIVQFAAGAPKALMAFVASGPKAAGDFISGLVAGIGAGASALGGAITNLASGALSSLKSLLAGGGAGTPGPASAGPAGKAIPAKANAVGGVVQPANGEVLASVAPGETIVPKGASIAGQGGGKGGGGTFQININVSGGGGEAGGKGGGSPQDIADAIEEKLALMLENLGLSQGLPA